MVSGIPPTIRRKCSSRTVLLSATQISGVCAKLAEIYLPAGKYKIKLLVLVHKKQSPDIMVGIVSSDWDVNCKTYPGRGSIGVTNTPQSLVLYKLLNPDDIILMEIDMNRKIIQFFVNNAGGEEHNFRELANKGIPLMAVGCLSSFHDKLKLI